MDGLTILCYPKCGTCRKAEQWLKAQGLEYAYRPIKEEQPTEAELAEWIAASGLPVGKFFNTSGLLYREHNIKDKLKTTPKEELIKILASDGMFVKRPILLRGGHFLCAGFKEEEWNVALSQRPADKP